MFTSKDREKCRQLFEKHYSGHKFKDVLYRELIAKHLSPGGRLLDAGCGRYLKFSKDFAAIAEIVGIDLESTLEISNRLSPFGVHGDLNRLPFPSDHFNLLISRSVVEHLECPEQVFREFFRMLKPGGGVILLMPNKSDYVSIIAAVTPYTWHRKLVSWIFRVPAYDVYPTLYRANTLSTIRKTLKTAGLAEQEVRTVNHCPAYLMFSSVLFRIGLVYERVTSLNVFAGLRGSILCMYEKEGAEALVC